MLRLPNRQNFPAMPKKFQEKNSKSNFNRNQSEKKIKFKTWILLMRRKVEKNEILWWKKNWSSIQFLINRKIWLDSSRNFKRKNIQKKTNDKKFLLFQFYQIYSTGSKKKWSPNPIQKQLSPVPSEGNFSVPMESPPVAPNHIRSVSHHWIKGRPSGRKNPIWWIKRRFVQILFKFQFQFKFFKINQKFFNF